tara:strand:+ start:195 stop:698 length:504 start_codon:yes stop_codon:yes gene_type:complete
MARLLDTLLDGNKKTSDGKTFKEQLLYASGSLISEEEDFSSIGFDLPFKVADPVGMKNATTRTKLEAVRVNVINLLNTELGERVMQPNLGIKLKRFLFQPFTDDVSVSIQSSIVNTFKYWLPFVQITNITVNQAGASGDFAHTIKVSVTFSLKDDPTAFDSVQVTVG